MELIGLFIIGVILGIVIGGVAMWAVGKMRIRVLEEKAQWYTQQIAEQKALHERALDDLRTTFKALSADALKQNAPEFLRLATTTLEKANEIAKGELNQRQEAIQGLVRPLEEQLKIYQARLQQQEVAQTHAQGELRKQLELLARQNETLSRETERFRVVLKSNQARGRWGEETLRRVVEAAGMSAHCDFIEQAQDDDKKPDMIVNLPGNRNIIVDAKTPELNFLSDLESSDAVKRAELLKVHVDKLRQTIRDLSRKGYAEKFPGALDYIVLFLPAESLFSTALEGDPDLLVWAAEQHRVMLATPATLIALLRAVSVSWTQFLQTENAKAIADAAQELFDRVIIFTNHFEKIREGLTMANKAVNNAIGSYELRIRPSGQQLQKLLATDKELKGVEELQ